MCLCEVCILCLCVCCALFLCVRCVVCVVSAGVCVYEVYSDIFYTTSVCFITATKIVTNNKYTYWALTIIFEYVISFNSPNKSMRLMPFYTWGN